MSKTCKKLLASALAAAMLITTFVSSFVVSAATTGTLEIKDTTITVGAEEAVVEFKLAFDAFVEAPHELATITANPALTIKDIALGDVTYETAPVDPEDPEIESPALKIKTDGINKNAGKVLFESGVDGAVKASEINFTVTFDTTAAEVGEYTVSAAVESTDINEADIVVNCEDTGIIVVEKAVEIEHNAVDGWLFDDNYHWQACSVENCDVHTGDAAFGYAEHNFGDWIIDTEASIVAKGSKHRDCACGKTETAEIEVTVPVIENAITFGTTVSFDHETSRIGIGYGYASDSDFRMKIVRPANNGTRTLWNVVVVNGKEYPFQLENVYTTGAELGVVGLSLEELNSATVEMFIRVCWTDSYGVDRIFETNKCVVDCAAVLADARANMGDDAQLNAFFALSDVWSGLTADDKENVSSEAIVFDEFVDGFTYYDGVTFNPAGCGVNVPYGYASDSAFRAGYRAANNGTRKAYTVITVNGKEYTFGADVYSTGATVGVVGLSIGDYQSSVSLNIRYTWTDEEGDHVYNTNKANITVHNYLVNSESDFAVAYRNYIATLN